MSPDDLIRSTHEKYRRVQEYDTDLKQLQIMSKLASGDKKRYLSIQKIKALRREALCQSYNSKIS